MSYRIAINGYGRIGQSILRAVYQRGLQEQLQVVAINELADLDTLTYLTRYDTTHGRFPCPVDNDGEALLINGDRIRVFSQAEPEQIPWGALEVDLVLECSGAFRTRADAERHLSSGARRLLYSHPAQADMDATVVFGYNQSSLRTDHHIVSAASCTTNCVVPVLDLLDRHFGIDSGVTTTIHSAMNDQPVIDSYHHDLRRTRAASQSIIPVDTKLAAGIERILPKFANKFEAIAVRVPTINVTAMDLSITVDKKVSIEDINACLENASDHQLKGILGYTEAPLVSVDFNHDPRSCIIDGTQTRVSDGHLVKLLVWCDNEWGFANRLIDVCLHLKSLNI